MAREGVRIDPSAKLIVIVVGDENGEDGRTFAAAFSEVGYKPAALALIVSLNPRFGRGRTVRDAASALAVPYSEVSVDQFSDPYQVPRVLRTILESPLLPGMGHGWLDRVLATPLLEKPA